MNNEVFLYGIIGYDVKANDFMQSLRDKEMTYDEIKIRINSEGGDYFQGLPLYNNLLASRSNIVADIDGLAASAATVVMCGAKKVRAARNSLLMVHGAMGGGYTNVENLEVIVDYMKMIKTEIAKVYAKKTGKTEQWVIDNWLSDGKEHWFTAEEALELKLVDEVFDADEISEAPKAAWGTQRVAAFYKERLSNSPINQNDSNMKKTIAALNATGLVSLNETAADELVEKGVQAIAGALGQKEAEITRLNGEITALKKKADDDKVAALKSKAETMVKANTAAGKITAAQEKAYIDLASASEEAYNSTKKILDEAKAYESVIPQLNLEGKTEVDLVKMWDEAFKDEKKMKALKVNAALYKEVYKAKFGKEPK